MKNVRLKERLYEAYRFDWMRKHNIRMSDIIDIASKIARQDKFANVKEIIESRKFNGEKWLTFDEFVDTVYIDAKYMKQIASERDYQKYIADRKLVTKFDLIIGIKFSWMTLTECYDINISKCIIVVGGNAIEITETPLSGYIHTSCPWNVLRIECTKDDLIDTGLTKDMFHNDAHIDTLLLDVASEDYIYPQSIEYAKVKVCGRVLDLPKDEIKLINDNWKLLQSR